jgi:hypothetical protein
MTLRAAISMGCVLLLRAYICYRRTIPHLLLAGSVPNQNCSRVLPAGNDHAVPSARRSISDLEMLDLIWLSLDQGRSCEAKARQSIGDSFLRIMDSSTHDVSLVRTMIVDYGLPVSAERTACNFNLAGRTRRLVVCGQM